MKNPTTLPSGNIIAAHRRLVLLIAVPVLLLLFAGGFWATLGGNLFRGTTPVVAVADCCAKEGAPLMARTDGLGEPLGGTTVVVPTEVLGVVAGTTIQFGSDGGAVRPFFVTAWYGETDDLAGTYTAPTFMPPYGEDFVNVSLSGLGNHSVIVRVLPNPQIEGSDQPRYVSVPDAFFDDSEPADPGFSLAAQLEEFEQYPVVLLPVSRSYGVPGEIIESQPLEIVQNGWLRVPSNIFDEVLGGDRPGEDLEAKPADEQMDHPILILLGREIAESRNLVNPPPGGCIPGTKEYGAEREVSIVLGDANIDRVRRLFVTLEISLAVKGLGVPVQPDTLHPYAVIDQQFRKQFKRTVRRCGPDYQWMPPYEEKCEQVGIFSEFNPRWVCQYVTPDSLSHMCQGKPWLSSLLHCQPK